VLTSWRGLLWEMRIHKPSVSRYIPSLSGDGGGFNLVCCSDCGPLVLVMVVLSCVAVGFLGSRCYLICIVRICLFGSGFTTICI
jgi:hypothetical protein